MNYQLRDRRKSSSTKVIFKIVGVAVIIWLLAFVFNKPLQSGLLALQQSIAYAFGYYNDPVRPISVNSLIQSLQTENEELRSLLGRKPETEDRIFTVVIARPPKTPYDSLVIDIGENQGILPGDLVYGEMNYLIGRVDEVSAVTSVVKLFSTPGEKIDAFLGSGSSTSAVVVEGRGGGNFYIKIPRNISVTEGDPIVISGAQSYVLGTAENIDSGEGEAYAHIYFKLPVKLNSLQYVQVKKAVR